MKRTCRSGSIFSRDIWIAISRMVAEPLPLSLIPGPSATESRWAPTTTAWPASPRRDVAMMLAVWRVSLTVLVVTRTVTGPVRAAVANAAPSG